MEFPLELAMRPVARSRIARVATWTRDAVWLSSGPESSVRYKAAPTYLQTVVDVVDLDALHPYHVVAVGVGL
jgi:hypothetical protein